MFVTLCCITRSRRRRSALALPLSQCLQPSQAVLILQTLSCCQCLVSCQCCCALLGKLPAQCCLFCDCMFCCRCCYALLSNLPVRLSVIASVACRAGGVPGHRGCRGAGLASQAARLHTPSTAQVYATPQAPFRAKTVVSVPKKFQSPFLKS